MKSKTVILAILSLSSLNLAAQVAYQGRLTDNNGAPINGSKSITFELYENSVGGIPGWSESQTVDTIDGRFSVTLGADGMINDPLQGHTYLQLTVEGEGGGALTPRQQILASPRAIVADSSRALGQTGLAPYISLDTVNNRIGVNTEAPDTDFQVNGVTKLFRAGTSIDSILEVWTELDPNASNPSRGLKVNGLGLNSIEGDLEFNMISNEPIRTGDGLFTVGDGGILTTGPLSSGPTIINGALTQTGASRLNGSCVINSTGSNTLTLYTPASGATFRRPFEILSSAGSLLMGYQLDQNGGSTGTGFVINVGTAYKPGGGSFAATSDGRLKKDVDNLHGSLDRLEQLRPVTFKFRNEERHGVSGTQIGFIAQEVEEVFPDWIHQRDNSTPLKEGESPEPEAIKTIGITGFEALTVDAFRELRAEKDAQIADLKTSNQALEDRVNALESKMTNLVHALESQATSIERTVSLK